MVEILTETHEEIDRLVAAGISALESNDMKNAHKLFAEAYEMNPEINKTCSYYGYTVALVEEKPHKGLELCVKAAKSAELDPMYYFNLGVIYFELGRRRESVGALKRGLKIDASNKKIFNYWTKNLGFRRKPVLPFLPRSNFINKFIGKLTYKG